MNVLISDIPPEGLDLELNEAVESDTIISPVRGKLRVEKVGTEIIITGNLEAEMKLECSRCLKEFHSRLSVPVQVVYHPVEDLKGADTHEVRPEELDMDFYSGEELDLLTLGREQIELNIPMKPLCSDACKGLCSRCGADLNRENTSGKNPSPKDSPCIP